MSISRLLPVFIILASLWISSGHTSAQPVSEQNTEVGDRLVAEYFQQETAALSTDIVLPGMTLPELQKQQHLDRQRLAEMLGLDPMPERTPLEPLIAGTETHDGFQVERLHFQPSPGLYVAANFYLPTQVDQPLPTILYVCGHANTAKDGVRPGNKAGYHHHGVWFAKNGYACLIVDTIQLGEFSGQNHGTYRLGKWWWNNRGYTPAGVEAWTGIRALDYLESRKEVDADRFGVTGRSGGGAYSWWIAALDQRVKVAVPVAGITTLKNHVVDGCVEGHCDCMYMVNTYRWDYGRVAALVTPRPLLISNSDKDTIFPLEGVVEIHRQVRDVYRLYGKADQLGLQITEGPHKDTQELRVHAFRWFNRFLKNDDTLIRSPAEKSIELNKLVVFDRLPDDEQVTSVDEWFVPEVQNPDSDWLETLREKSFGGWPGEAQASEAQASEAQASEQQAVPLDLQRVSASMKDGIRCEVYEFDSQQPYRFPLFVFSVDQPAGDSKNFTLEVLDQSQWQQLAGGIASIAPESLSDTEPSVEAFQMLAKRVTQNLNQVLVLFAPRGVGPTEWARDTKKRTHIQRRFMLLGQTHDAMCIWDVRRAIAAVRTMPTFHDSSLVLRGTNQSAAWALYASLFDTPVSELQLRNLPTGRDGITLLNVSKVVNMPSVIAHAGSRTKLTRLDEAD